MDDPSCGPARSPERTRSCLPTGDAVASEQRGAVDSPVDPSQSLANVTEPGGRVCPLWEPRHTMHLSVPEQLPIAAHVEEISRALRDHQVVVVAGETGSGKTTQLPKIALAAGRGRTGMIGHTQPRRIAARTLAARIAEECGVELGAEVGFAVRFTDRTAKGTKVKVMTDGILLAELQRDRDLRRYDTIIIDEAHERSLNIDFLLGYLTRLLPAPPRPAGDRHQRHHRCRAVLGTLRRCSDHRGERSHVPG